MATGDDGWVHLAVAAAGGFIGADGRGWLPTSLADRWRTDSLWGQWVSLRDAWRRIPQLPGSLGNTLDASSPATARAWRRLVHEELSTAEPGTPVEAGLVADVVGAYEGPETGEYVAELVERFHGEGEAGVDRQ